MWCADARRGQPLSPPLHDWYHNRHHQGVVEESADECDGQHETELCGRLGFGGPEDFTHVPVEGAVVTDACGDEEQYKDGQEAFVGESGEGFADGYDADGIRTREPPLIRTTIGSVPLMVL